MTKLTKKPAEVVEVVRTTLLNWGATHASAEVIARHLVDSDLSGHPSHGTLQMFRYRSLIDSGECLIEAEPTIIDESGAVARIDGNGGLGHPALALAVERAAALADQFGVGVGSVVRCGHAGRMGAWMEEAAKRGKFAMVTLAASDPPFAMTALPGAMPSMQTNPIAMGAMASQVALVLDMATSAVAGGKIMVAKARGEQVPEGWIIDAAGQPTTDPDAFFAGGALLPAAGHKGYGMAMMVEALSVGLIGADGPGLTPVSGSLVVCFEPSWFRPVEATVASIDGLRQRVHESDQSGRTLVPGELEAKSRLQQELEIGEDLWSFLLRYQK